jgi:hypothetical protein
VKTKCRRLHGLGREQSDDAARVVEFSVGRDERLVLAVDDRHFARPLERDLFVFSNRFDFVIRACAGLGCERPVSDRGALLICRIFCSGKRYAVGAGHRDA